VTSPSRQKHSRERAEAFRVKQRDGGGDVAVVHAAGSPSLPDDPVVGLRYNGRTSSLYGLTPERLGAYLTEYYAGTYANIARIWEVMENRDDTLAPLRADKLFGKVGKELDNYEIIIPGYDDMAAPVKAEAERHAEWIGQEMTAAIAFDVPLKVDVACGPSWLAEK